MTTALLSHRYDPSLNHAAPLSRQNRKPWRSEAQPRWTKGRIYFRSQRSGEISAECLPITGKLLPGRNQVGKLPVNESTSLWGADDSAGRTFFPAATRR